MIFFKKELLYKTLNCDKNVCYNDIHKGTTPIIYTYIKSWKLRTHENK